MDIDHIAGGVNGSVTSKKYMRNQLWSLMYHVGSPIWYITLSPVDVKHPLCVYLAGTDTKFSPVIKTSDERLKLVTSNPVAGARFFKYVVETFISDILGFDKDSSSGLYGDVEAYFGTVEQQGRLTLHLHAAIWIRGSLSPKDLRECLMNQNSVWNQKITDWLESCHAGEFMTGSMVDLDSKFALIRKQDGYVDPISTLPSAPPKLCSSCLHHNENCPFCCKENEWWTYYEQTVDDIILQSNVHDCERYLNKDGSQNKNHVYRGCRDNKWGKCKARFPRALQQETKINDDGSIVMKKLEEWINTYTPALSYLFRCNTDVACLLSGTAVKAIVISVLDRNAQAVGEPSVDSLAKARQMMTKVVNMMSSKMEYGSPMICMYLLGHPDHYSSHSFVTFYWCKFVSEAHELSDLNLYDWICRCSRLKNTSIKRGKSHQDEFGFEEDDNDEIEAEDLLAMAKDARKKLQGGQRVRKYLDFKEGHPLKESHKCCLLLLTHIKLLKRRIVPNFIGTPPRRDQGDREYYCSVMLALFCPWRSGKDLKTDSQSWEEAFNLVSFTPLQTTVMGNFNLRYECLDARDDFSAKMKGEDAHGFQRWLDQDVGSSEYQHNSWSGVELPFDSSHSDVSRPLSAAELRRR
ncbi:hypothetical protein IMY05_C4454000100 [Salix suchowensis]|nr:hypothetical protein IMY05_C4454000100 [Salix suchowensis]